MNKQTGFTLIESLIYLALFTLIIGGGMISAYQIIQASEAAQNHVVLQQEANFLFRKFTWMLSGATNMNVNSSALSVNKLISGTATEVTLSQNANTITLRRGIGDAKALTTDSVKASDLLFTNIPVTDNKPAGVTLLFTLTTAQNGRTAIGHFSTTKYLRK